MQHQAVRERHDDSISSESMIRGLIKSEAPNLVRERMSALLVEELEVTRRARVDIAIISDRLIGIEIKGPRDDVSRLPRQVAAYSECFERVVLVVHEALVERAMPIIPRWWGVVIARDNEGSLLWAFDRRPRPNPSLNPDAFLSLLWRDEIAALHERLVGGALNSKASKKALREELLAHATFATLRRASLEMLRNRKEWRGMRVHH